MTDRWAEQGEDVAEEQLMGLKRTMVADLAAVPGGEAVRVCGWIRAARGQWLEMADCTGVVAVTLERLGAGSPDPLPAVGDAVEIRALAGASAGPCASAGCLVLTQ